MKKLPIYVALTTIHEASGWQCRAAGYNAEAVRAAAIRIIGKGDDIYTQTEQINLVVVSVREASLHYRFNWRTFVPDPYSRYEWVPTVEAGRVAMQQALVKYHGKSYREAAKIMKISTWSCWYHVQAAVGSKIAPWESRPAEERVAAIRQTQALLS